MKEAYDTLRRICSATPCGESCPLYMEQYAACVIKFDLEEGGVIMPADWSMEVK